MLQKQLQFAKIIVNVWLSSEYTLDSEYTRILNIPGFRICQDSEYASGSEYARILNIPGL